MRYQEAVKQAAKELNIPEDTALLAYTSMWKLIREKAGSLDLKNKEVTEAELFEMKPNFNLPLIGKLSVTIQRINNIRKKKQWKS